MKTNVLYYGDNLSILRNGDYFPDESVDLVYLDPPFNSKRDYNLLFKEKAQWSEAQVKAFGDSWHWTETTEAAYRDVIINAPLKLSKLVEGMVEGAGGSGGWLGRNDVTAYLVMMALRLQELHRVLKKTGSLYLHCDPTASHYLKLVLDQIFGPTNFRNELVWKRTQAHNDPKRCGNVHDVILNFVKDSGQAFWCGGGHRVSEEYLKSHYFKVDDQGRHYQLVVCHAPGPGPARIFFGKTIDPPLGRHWTWTQENIDKLIAEGRIVQTRTGGLRLIQYAPDAVPLQDIWADIDPVNSQAKERLGYETQKPLALLERIIQASSNENDIVLDPFCGCGTAVVAAHKLKRCWIGIDITHLAIAVMRNRLEGSFPGIKVEVVGEPADVAGARALAHQKPDGRYQFQWWALSLVKARPVGERKKGADQGIDGFIPFLDDHGGTVRRAVVQVKSGHVGVKDIRELKDVASKEAMGVLITLEPPTRDMEMEALGAGTYHSPLWDKDYPRIQILTIEDLFQGKAVNIPPSNPPFAKASRLRIREGEQPNLV